MRSSAVRTRYEIDALTRGLDVMRLFDSGRRSLSLSQICRLLGRSPASTLRAVRTLCDCGYLERLVAGSAYQPSIAVAHLGWHAIAAMPVVEAARQPMQRLFSATGWTVNLGVMVGDSVYYVRRIRATNILVGRSPIAERLPAYCTSAGKAILGALRPEARANYMRDVVLTPHGPRTILNKRKLAAALVENRRAGYAIQDQEFGFGLRSIAAPIHAPDGGIAGAINVAVGVAGMSVEQMKGSLAGHVIEAAHEIEHRLVQRAGAAFSRSSAGRRPAPSFNGRSRYHVSALGRGCRVMSLLAERGETRLTDVGRLCGLTPSTAFRVLNTLERCGVAGHSRRGEYSLTPRAIECGYSAFSALELPELAHAELADLSAKVDGNVHVGIVAGLEVINVLSFRRTDLIALHGNRFPLYCTATGKLWLSEQPLSQLREILPRLDMSRIGPRTITRSIDLLEDLRKTRMRGYSVSDEEIYPGICVFAGPVRALDGELVACISLAVQKRRRSPDSLAEELAPLVVRAADRTSERLRYVIQDEPISPRRAVFSRKPAKSVHGGRSRMGSSRR